MTSFAHGISLTTEDSRDFLGLQVDGAQAPAASAAGCGSFRVFSLACSFKMTRRWTFFTASFKSCSRSSVSWFGKDRLAKEGWSPSKFCTALLKNQQFQTQTEADESLSPTKTSDCTRALQTWQHTPGGLHRYSATIRRCFGAESPSGSRM